MTIYSGEVKDFELLIFAPNIPSNNKNAIVLKGDFGTAYLFFVPPDGSLGTNRKQDPGRAVRERPLPGFYIYYWMYSYAQFVDMLRNEKPVFFVFEDFEGWATLVTDLDAVGEARHA
jgi:hypothetical protein